jgi:prepilin-type N-terminal cleavage/methylation domain-containing protein
MRGRRGRRRQSGFTLVELLISLLIVSLALGFASRLLMEVAVIFADSAADTAGDSMPLALGRLRSDARAARSFEVLADPAGDPMLLLSGHPAGDLLYERQGTVLLRSRLDPGGAVLDQGVAARGVLGWDCRALAPGLLEIAVTYRHRIPRTGSPVGLPGQRGPGTAPVSETFTVAPRGAGLGEGW